MMDDGCGHEESVDRWMDGSQAGILAAGWAGGNDG